MRIIHYGYVAVLTAVGLALAACSGSSPSRPTPGPCTYTLSATSLSFAASGGPGVVNVTTAGHCTWSAVSDRTWISITSGASGTGNGVVNVRPLGNWRDGYYYPIHVNHLYTEKAAARIALELAAGLR